MMRAILFSALLLIASTAAAQSPFLPMDGRPFTAPKHAGWVFDPSPYQVRFIGVRWYGLGYRPAGSSPFAIGNFWSRAVVAPDFSSNYVLADDGSWYTLVAPTGAPGFWYVK